MNRPVLAYHAVLSTYGFWLPNDPRGSCSTEVRAENLRPFGPATTVDTHRSVAARPHDRRLRYAAKRALVRPEVRFSGVQALSVGRGFGAQTRKCGYKIYACTILPQHAHLVIGWHHYPVEQVIRLLRKAATERLIADGLHPFERLPNGKLPSVWGRDSWPVFLDTPEAVRRCIAYVENNPLRESKPRQRWSFVIPYEG